MFFFPKYHETLTEAVDHLETELLWSKLNACIIPDYVR